MAVELEPPFSMPSGNELDRRAAGWGLTGGMGGQGGLPSSGGLFSPRSGFRCCASVIAKPEVTWGDALNILWEFRGAVSAITCAGLTSQRS